MGLKSSDIIVTLVFNLVHYASTSDHILSCNVTSLYPCPGAHQICDQKSLRCICEDQLQTVDGECVEPGAAPPPAHGATAAVVAIFTLALVTCGLYLVIRKYNLVEYARQKINVRRSHDVMYEDVMIGQDDPPLSP